MGRFMDLVRYDLNGTGDRVGGIPTVQILARWVFVLDVTYGVA
jgi:hypothetical protein